jgi:hypothetical protein
MLFSLLVRAAEPAPMLPEPLLSAAARIEKGDFAARAPLAGQLGAVATAPNRAAEAPPFRAVGAAGRGPLRACGAARRGGSVGVRVRAASGGAAGAAAWPRRRRRTPSCRRRPPRSHHAASGGDRCRRRPRRRAARGPAELLQAAAQAAPPDDAGDDEQTHWRQVFSDFLRTRGECGEVASGLTFERFAQKLASNKAALVAKYSCRTVRFQVYVKDGKAALKATPVR